MGLPLALGRVRRADVKDAGAIEKLMNESVKETFRYEAKADLISLIEYAVLSICHLDVEDRIVGFLSVKDYPVNPSIHPKAWEDYIWAKFKAVDLRSRNTLFIHMLCWDKKYAREVVDNMMKTIFMHDSYLNNIAIVKSLPKYPCLMPGQPRAEASFRRYSAIERGVPSEKLPSLYVAERKEVCPRLRIRRAVEEDNDDIVDIITKHSRKLTELYGDFYISEIVSRHPDSERALLVCEDNEVAVGVMCLNTQINFESLQENYELSIYSGLRRYFKETGKRLSSEISVNASLSNVESAMSAVDQPDAEQQKQRISWSDEARIIMTRDGLIKSDRHQSMALSHLEFLEYLENDEDEEEDFDIVNIDTDLLRLPPLMSYDEFCSVTSLRNLMLHKEEDNKGIEQKISFREKAKTTGSTNGSNTTQGHQFSGPSNAFLLELFAMSEDYDERYGFDMLEGAFDLFPNRDYCIISLPTDHAAFSLIDTHFTSVTPTANKLKFVKETLYIAHVNSVRGLLSVRPSEASDVDKVKTIIRHSPKNSVIMDYFLTSFLSETIESYVFLAENLPVGVMIIGPLKDGSLVRSQYELSPDPPRQQTDGAIIAGIVSPAFEPHSRWFFREVIRQSEFTTVYWICRLVAKEEANPKDNMMSLAGQMVPVRSRRHIPNIGEKNTDKLMFSPFSLWVMERPLTSLPRVDVNHSIVVVGASTTGLSFIEALILGSSSSYLTMTNLTLVSEHGLPTISECLRAADICVPHRGKYTDRYMKAVPFYFYVDVVVGVLDKIDRSRKCIHLKNGGTKYYDELVLTCGRQFQHPYYMQQSQDKHLDKGKCERILMDDPKFMPDVPPSPPELPENVMIINSLFDSNRALRRLMRMISDNKQKTPLSPNLPILVYGDNLEAYSCVSALLDLGISGDMIIFVEPFPPKDEACLRVNCFNDQTVDERVQSGLQVLGVQVHAGHFYGWILDSSRKVTCVKLISKYNIEQLPCFALFYFGQKAIDINLFKAINECGLVYDGGIVIGPEFDTNDPHIYAAGSCTKYSRRLYANRYSHVHYCSEEIGESLAGFYMRKLDPFLIARHNSTQPDILPYYSLENLLVNELLSKTNAKEEKMNNELCRWTPVPAFILPIIIWAVLPGPLYYYTLRRPGPDLPMEIAASLPEQGHALTTDKNGNYFYLQLNSLHCVQSITCLSKDPHQPEIFANLYMKHESYYGNLLERYRQNKIDDLFEYFNQSWMTAMHQDTFEDLLDDIRNDEMGTVYDIVKSNDALSELSVSCDKDSYKCFGPENTPDLGTFLNILEKLLVIHDNKEGDCGQSSYCRGQALALWKTVEGEKMVLAHIARYLTKYNSSNGNYFAIKQ